jgi:hypothetical protein
MAGVVAVTVALFLGGVVTGVIVVVALAVRREDRRYTLVREAPTGCRTAPAGSTVWAAGTWTPSSSRSYVNWRINLHYPAEQPLFRKQGGI